MNTILICGLSKRVVTSTSCIRYLSVSATNHNMLSWFRDRKKKQEEVWVPNNLKQDTSKLIDKIEKGEQINDVDAVQKQNSDYIELSANNFIGEDDKTIAKKLKREEIKKLKEYNEKFWLYNQKKVKTSKELDEIIINCFNDTMNGNVVNNIDDKILSNDFSNLESKFLFTKYLQVNSGYMISDFDVSKLNSPISFKQHFEKEIISGKLGRFKESEPNAIHIDSTSFTAPNVYVQPDITFKRQNKKFGKIIKEVQELENDKDNKIIQQI